MYTLTPESTFYSILSRNIPLGSSLIIHSQPDDFTSQPSGNSGEKIGCGIIQPVRRSNM